MAMLSKSRSSFPRSHRSPPQSVSFSSLSGQDKAILTLILIAVVWFAGIILYVRSTYIYTRINDTTNKDNTSTGKHYHFGVEEPNQLPVDDHDKGSIDDDSPTPSSWSHLPNAAIVIVTYNRLTYLRQTISTITLTPGIEHFHLYVSQDGSDPDLSSLVSEYKAFNLTLIHHPRNNPVHGPGQGGTAWLAQHYKWMFDQLFSISHHSHVVVVEDDMLVSPDFLWLMRDTAYLLENDPTVWCVSSWHDNGRNGMVYDPYRLFRTDYFPGLGWMLSARVWEELSGIFPSDHWDHYLRLDSVHKHRSCVVPEISRNKNIGEQGTNIGGSFFSRFLAPIAHQQQPVHTFNRAGQTDCQHLAHDEYQQTLRQQMENAQVLGNIADPTVQAILRQIPSTLTTMHNINESFPQPRMSLIVYGREHWEILANMFTLHPVPRSIHQGITIHRFAQQQRSNNKSRLVDQPMEQQQHQTDGQTSSTDPDESHWLFAVDRRKVKYSDYLPSWLNPSSRHHHLIWTPNPNLLLFPSAVNEHCDSACSRARARPADVNSSAHYVCSADHFSYINECSVLQRIFPCERGCAGGVAGPDVPNYVVAKEKPDMYQKCLVNEHLPVCSASHWSAQRLCPCVPS